MSLFLAAFTVVTALSLLNLAATGAVLRQLRIPASPATPPAGFSTAHLVGRSVGSELATPVAGERVDIAAFFSPGCPACHAQAPRVAELARSGSGVVAVIAHADHAADDSLGDLLATTPVVTGAPADALINRLDVSVFPTFVRLNPDREIVAASFALDDLLAWPVNAAR